MKVWKRQAGEGRAGCILWTLILIFGAIAAMRWVPVKIATVELKDKMEEAAQLMPRGTEKQYVDHILHHAEDLRLPVVRKDIKVKKAKERVQMEVKFVIPLDLFVYTHHWNVHIKVDRDIFLI